MKVNDLEYIVKKKKNINMEINNKRGKEQFCRDIVLCTVFAIIYMSKGFSNGIKNNNILTFLIIFCCFFLLMMHYYFINWTIIVENNQLFIKTWRKKYYIDFSDLIQIKVIIYRVGRHTSRYHHRKLVISYIENNKFKSLELRCNDTEKNLIDSLIASFYTNKNIYKVDDFLKQRDYIYIRTELDDMSKKIIEDRINKEEFIGKILASIVIIILVSGLIFLNFFAKNIK